MKVICNQDTKVQQQVCSGIMLAPQFQNRRTCRTNNALNGRQGIIDMFYPSSQPAQCRSQGDLRAQSSSCLFPAQTALSSVDDFFDFRQSTRKTTSKGIGQKTDALVSLWTIPPGYQAIFGELPGIGPMLCKSTPSFGVKWTTIKFRLFPGSLLYVLLNC